MEKVRTLDEYYAWITDIKKEYGKSISTNCYLSTDAVKRLLGQGRFYVVRVENGIVFLSDEESYYRGYYYWDCEKQKHFPALKKPLLVKLMYYRETKKQELLLNGHMLSLSGFKKADTNFQMEIRAEKREEINRQLQLFYRVMKKGNFTMGYAELRHYKEILHLREETKEFSCFTFPYLSEEEVVQGIEEHSYICVFDEAKNICATTYVDYSKIIPEGNGVCVREEYKKRYGFGGALLYRALQDAFDRGYLKYQSWITEGHVDSIQFHERIGFEYTKRAEDDWIMGEEVNE